jgi:hypothetical protein
MVYAYVIKCKEKEAPDLTNFKSAREDMESVCWRRGAQLSIVIGFTSAGSLLSASLHMERTELALAWRVGAVVAAV